MQRPAGVRLRRVLVLAAILLRVATPPNAAAGTSGDHREAAPHDPWMFDHIPGLSSSYVTSLIQDRTGYVWIGTADGLNRYDGYECRSFRYHPDDPNGPAGSFISGLAVDGAGDLWVSLGIGGADIYDARRESFVHLVFVSGEGPPEAPPVTAIVTDGLGRTWAGTQRGLYLRSSDSDVTLQRIRPRFAGVSSAEDPFSFGITAMCADAHAIWMGTRRGLYRIDLDQEASRPAMTGGTEVEAVPLPGSREGGLGVDSREGQLGVDGREGQLGVDSREDQLGVDSREGQPGMDGLEREPWIQALAIGPAGEVWAGTRGGSLWRRANTVEMEARNSPSGAQKDPAFTLVSSALPGRAEASGRARRIVAIEPDSAGGAWIVRGGGSLEHVDQAGRWCSAPGGAWSSDGIRAFAVSERGLFLGTTGGLVQWPRRTPAQVHPTRPLDRHEMSLGALPSAESAAHHGLAAPRLFRHHAGDATTLGADVVTAILTDSRGGLWVGTDGGGVAHHDPRRTRFVSAAWPPRELGDPSRAAVCALLEDSRRRLWIGTPAGLVLRDGDREEVLRIPHLSDSKRPVGCGALFESRDRTLWLGTTCGLARVSEGQGEGQAEGRRRFEFTFVSLAAPSETPVSDIAEDAEHCLWLATSEGLVWLDPARGLSRLYTADSADPASLPSRRCAAVAVAPDGSPWVGTLVGGLSRLDRMRGGFDNYRPGTPGGLSNLSVQALRFSGDGRSLWIGTYSGGLDRLDLSTLAFDVWTERDGLPGDKVNAIVEDPAGILWLTTNAGLARLDPATGRITRYDAGDGLPGNEFRARAACATAGGEVIVGSVTGYCRFDPADIVPDPQPPPVVLTAFRCYDRVVPLGQLLDSRGRLVLTHRNDFLGFDFAALDFAAPSRARYACRLEGFDEGWNDCGARRYASYTNLDPGRYTFRVRAANRDGAWNEGVYPCLWSSPPRGGRRPGSAFWHWSERAGFSWVAIVGLCGRASERSCARRRSAWRKGTASAANSPGTITTRPASF